MAVGEEAFPRGAKLRRVSAGTERRGPAAGTLFGVYHDNESKKRKQKKKLKPEKTETQMKNKSVVFHIKQKTEPEILSLKTLRVGTLLLGCVKEVTDVRLIIGLPHGLTGYVSVINICDAYTESLKEQLNKELSENVTCLSDLYSRGMIVRCVVSKLITNAEHSSLKLSINPKDVNKALPRRALRAGMLLSGCVSSVEDHGYLVDIGVEATKAFLSLEKAQEYIKNRNRGLPLRVGQYLTSLVESVKNNGRIVQLSTHPADVASALATEDQNWNLGNLLPGLVMRAEVKKLTEDGLVLQFLSGLSGSVNFMHLDPQKIGTYHEGQKLKACILYVQPDTNSVHLTLWPLLLQPGSVLQQPNAHVVGEIVENCMVLQCQKEVGVIFQLQDGSFAYSHKLQLSDTKRLLNSSRFMEGTKHRGRVIYQSPMEQMALLSLKKTVIDAPFLSYQDITVGQLVKCKVTSLEKCGMIVKLSEYLWGLVPQIHLADIPVNHRKKLYNVGDYVKCRVLAVNSEMKKLFLTRKKTLITSKLRLITQYEDAKPNQSAHGYIVDVKPYGCIVQFYNEVKGLVPIEELNTQRIPFPKKAFYVGQVVKVTVLKCDPTQEDLILSLKGTQKARIGADSIIKIDKKSSMYSTGKIVDVEVLAKMPSGLEVSILPERVPAFLPETHLSDHLSICRLLAERLVKGDILSNVMCLSQTRGQIILCRKAAMIAFAERGSLPKKVLDLQVGMQMPGLVKNVVVFGVFVEFPHGLVGLVPKAAMSDKFVTNTEDHFVVGQTVIAKVSNLDVEKKRMLLTLKVSECGFAESDSEGFSLLRQYLGELDFVRSLMSSRESAVVVSLSQLIMGQRLKLVVNQVKDDGTMYFTGARVTRLTVTASRYHQGEGMLSPGVQCTAVVLFVDLLLSIVHVSLRQELLTNKVIQLKGVSQRQVVVQFVNPDICVVSLAGSSQLLLIPVTFHLNDTFLFDFEKLRVGQTISVHLQTTKMKYHGIPVATGGPKKARRIKHQPWLLEGEEEEFTGIEHTLCVGDVVNGTVKSVRPDCLRVALKGGVTGYVHVSEILDKVPVGIIPTSKQKVGSVVRAKVIGGKKAGTHIFLPGTHPNFKMTIPQLSLRPSRLSGTCASLIDNQQLVNKLKSFTLGQELTCFVFKYNFIKKFLEVDVAPDIRGKIELLLLSADIKKLKHPEKKFRPGESLRATVTDLSRTDRRVSLSLTGVCSLAEGSVTLGIIKKIIPHVGIIISLPLGKTGQAELCDMADSYREAPLEGMTPGRIVRCCIISKGEDHLAVSLRNSRVCGKSATPVPDPEITSVTDLRKGKLLRGYIKSIEEPGIFVSLSASVSGRVHYHNVTNYIVKDHQIFLKNIPKGKLVTVKVLSVNKEEGHVELSLLPEDTGKPDLLPKSLNLLLKQPKRENNAEEKVRKRKRRDSESEQLSSKKLKLKKKQKRSEKNGSGVGVYCREVESDSDVEQQQSPTKPDVARLQIFSSFAWDVSLNTIAPVTGRQEDTSSDSEEDETGDSKPKMKRREKEAAKRQMEKELAKTEQQLMDPSRQPQTADDFDRLVLSSPNSSIIWMQYMAFHLHTTEIEKARAVAERALKTISFREEQEKLNIWVAFLNLENLYGTEESLMKVFERAVQYSEPVKVFQKLADIYAKSEKYKQAESLYSNMLRRFRQDSSVWLSYTAFLLKQGKTNSTNTLLQRALKSLPQREHVDVIAKFAQLEFHFGDSERAKAMFENMLSSYPKRIDLWSIYIDMMLKHGNQEQIRHLFERVIHLKLAPKKMKFFFKRYLEYEKRYGNEECVQAVKEKALQYVESKSSLGS